MAFLSESVFGYRRKLMRDVMEANHVAALLFSSPEFFQFATNFHVDVQTWERPIAAVVPKDGEPFVVMHELSTNHVRFHQERGAFWPGDVHFYGEHVRLTGRLPTRAEWPGLVAGLLRQHGLGHSRIGVESGAGWAGKVAAAAPELKFVELLEDLRVMRWVKHGEELTLHRQAAALCDFGQELYRKLIRPGRLVQELDFTLAGMVAEEGARRYPGEHLEPRCMTLTGVDSSSPHGNGAPTGARFQEGDGVVVICNMRLNGMMTENERTYFVGRPGGVQREAFAAAHAANAAGKDAARLGNRVSDIDAAAQEVIEKAGFGDRILHRTGHGLGVQGHEYPDDMPFNQRPLRANEVYSIEPGIYVYGLGGFRIDDTVVVGLEPEVLTASPRGLDECTLPV
ncbi:aminopeptidase P family protein [bacterium]|nr:MAG: aminopeptidase P family protein [bacterium]